MVLAALLGLTAWQGLHSEALAEASAAYEGRPAETNLRSAALSWWQSFSGDRRGAAGLRRRRAAELAESRPDYQRALQRALDHLDARPQDRRAARLAALSLSQLDFASQAERYYGIARERTKLSLDDLHIRAIGLTRSNLRDQAVAAYQEILEQWPDDPLALQRLAAIYYSRSQFHQALQTASRLAQSTDPKYAVAGYSLIALVHHDEFRHDLAAEAADQVLRIDPELKLLASPPELFLADLAEDLIQTGRAVDARRCLHRALQSRETAELLDLLGATYYTEGEEAEAEQCWKHASVLDPKLDRPWLHLGRLEMRRGHWAEAATYLEKAHRIDPQEFEPLYQLSLVYRRLGRARDSEEFRKKAAEAQRRRLANAGATRTGMGTVPDVSP
jgi:tetratricopeptide (TPR) repeat protein